MGIPKGWIRVNAEYLLDFSHALHVAKGGFHTNLAVKQLLNTLPFVKSFK